MFRFLYSWFLVLIGLKKAAAQEPEYCPTWVFSSRPPMVFFSAVVVSVLRPGPRWPGPPAAGQDAQVGPPEGGVAQRVQNLEGNGGNRIKFIDIGTRGPDLIWDLFVYNWQTCSEYPYNLAWNLVCTYSTSFSHHRVEEAGGFARIARAPDQVSERDLATWHTRATHAQHRQVNTAPPRPLRRSPPPPTRYRRDGRPNWQRKCSLLPPKSHDSDSEEGVRGSLLTTVWTDHNFLLSYTQYGL